MNAKYKIALFVLLVALLALGVSALSVTSPTLGGENQERGKNVSVDFTIKNDQTAPVYNLTIALTAESKYNIQYSPATIAELGPGETKTVKVNATIPLDHPAVDSSLKEAAIDIGDFTVTGKLANGTETTATGNIMMQAANKLKLKSVRLECGAKSKKVSDGDKIEDLKPGTACSLEATVENTFSESSDISFDEVTVSVESSDDDSIDVDEEEEIDSLDADDEDSVAFDFEIEDDADAGIVTLEIKAYGKDDNGAMHGKKISVKLEIERLTHDIQIRRAELSPAKISNCKDVDVRLTVNILNMGKRDEDEVAVEASCNELGFTKKVTGIELDNDDSTTTSFMIPIPARTAPGIYRINIQTFFDKIAPSQSGSVDLVIEKCTVVEEEEEEEEEVTIVTPPTTQPTVVVPPTTTTPTTAPQAAPKREEQKFTESPVYLGMLAALCVLIVLVIVLLVVVFRKKKA